MDERHLYSRGTDILTVMSEDCTGRRIGKQRASAQDEKEVARIFQAVIDKYGLKLKVVPKDGTEGLEWVKADENFSF